MKILKIVCLLFLPFVLNAQNIFTSTNRANIWIEDNNNRKSFSIDEWSAKAEIEDKTIITNGTAISSSLNIPSLRVLVNDIPTSRIKIINLFML